MKKLFILSLFLFLFTNLFAITLPDSLYGIWEGKDRIVFFEQTEEGTDEVVILLKEYYGWYYDRVAEPASYDEKEKRTRNSGTTRYSEHVYIENLKKTYESGENIAGEIKVKFSNHQKNTIPFVIVDGNMYLDYLQQNDEDKLYYMGNAKSKGFLVSEQSVIENILGYIIDGDKLYDIRYWKSDMDYSEETAKLVWKDSEYYVPKHIYSGENNYSCVSGRSKKIRNVVAQFEYKENDFYFTEDKQILIRDKEPYLTKLADKSTFEDLMQIVKNANSRRKPDPDPIFPPNDVNWHWDLIDMLEANNELIQQVRARQRSFGPRPKDINK